MEKRKGTKVVGLHEVRSPDIITREEAQKMAEQQATAWEAERVAHDMRSAIEKRLRMGAKWQADGYYWDGDLKMVRSRKVVGE